MKKVIEVSKDLSLPIDLVTQTVAILAKRRSGKSYTARRLSEQLLKAEQQIVVVDPKGDQWGIRHSADGKNEGYPIIILGGEHGDLPLEVNAGEVVAKLVVEERVSVLLDLSAFRKYEIATFMAAFLENLYRLKAQEIYRTPVMVVCDEADAIAPQKPQANEARMLGAIEDIVRRGGQRGIGTILITQRSAVLNKNVLTQAQMLIVLRLIAPQDIAAMKAWVDVHGTPEEAKELIGSLPSLPVGDAWFWSPGWPDEAGIFKRTHVLPIETFDSGATPKAGEKKVIPKKPADVDLNALQKQMAATIERAKFDDPKELKKKIAELERQLQTTSTKDHARALEKAVIERDMQWKKKMAEAQREISRLGRICAKVAALVNDYGTVLNVQSNSLTPVDTVARIHHEQVTAAEKAMATQVFTKPYVGITADIKPDGDLSGPEQRIIDAIAWMESVEITEPEQTAVAFLAGYKVGGGAFNNPKGSLRGKGYIEYVSGNKIKLTEVGREKANFPNAVLSPEELQRKVLERLPGPESKLLTVLLEVYPETITNEELAKRTEYAVGGGAYNNPRGRLKTLGLIEYVNGGVRARDILFLN